MQYPGLRIPIQKIISGGQTGVDQAALMAARDCGIAMGGWCPPGRECESGTIPSQFPLMETPYARSARAQDIPRSLRSEWNVRDSDATLILTTQTLPDEDPGTEWSRLCALDYSKPYLVCDVTDTDAIATIIDWLAKHEIKTLNIAGPSESAQPGIGAQVYKLLNTLLSQCSFQTPNN